jgi:long-chain acyl-CoA synthetase
VPLTHRNLLEGVRNGWQGGAFDFGEDVLAYLPMAWVGDFAITVAAGVALRFTINIPERAETVLHDLREIAPTFYLARRAAGTTCSPPSRCAWPTPHR